LPGHRPSRFRNKRAPANTSSIPCHVTCQSREYPSGEGDRSTMASWVMIPSCSPLAAVRSSRAGNGRCRSSKIHRQGTVGPAGSMQTLNTVVWTIMLPSVCEQSHALRLAPSSTLVRYTVAARVTVTENPKTNCPSHDNQPNVDRIFWS
jgi:hypothetical protein